LMINMRKQAEKFGVEVIEEDTTEVNFGQRPFRVNNYQSKAVIIATGRNLNGWGYRGRQN